MFGHGELFAMYRTNFMMFHHFNYNMSWFEEMIPFEREIYTHMLIEHLEKEKTRLQK